MDEKRPEKEKESEGEESEKGEDEEEDEEDEEDEEEEDEEEDDESPEAIDEKSEVETSLSFHKFWRAVENLVHKLPAGLAFTLAKDEQGTISIIVTFAYKRILKVSIYKKKKKKKQKQKQTLHHIPILLSRNLTTSFNPKSKSLFSFSFFLSFRSDMSHGHIANAFRSILVLYCIFAKKAKR